MSTSKAAPKPEPAPKRGRKPDSVVPAAGFTPQTFAFLRALAANNDREWFAANRQAYEQAVRAPFLQLIADLAVPLQAISPHFVADPRPSGGSMFRIHRDTRFSGDKSPYKTHVGGKLFHERARSIEAQTPVFYVHIAPDECLVAAGLWHPDADGLRAVRQYLLNNPASWSRITRDADFRARYTLGGESLARPPRGFDPQHELIDDLRRKDFIAVAHLPEAAALQADFPRLVAEHFRRLAPLVDWLCGALDLEF